MSLPFLNQKRVAGSIMATRKAEGGIMDEDMEGQDPLHSAMEDLHSAMKAGNIEEMASAMRAAFQMLDAEPHEEGPHTEGEE